MTEASARTTARWAGIFEILEATAATYGQVVIINKLVVSGNASATAANILAHEFLFRFGFAACLFGVGFHIVWALLVYELFKPVDRSVARFGLVVIIVGCAIQALAAVFYIAPLLILTAGNSLGSFTPDQLRALAYGFIKLNGAAFNAYLVFFGVWCAATGYLIARSRCLPRIVGWLLLIDGIAWMTYLSPPLGNYLFPVIAVVSAFAEIPLPWFFIFGFNAKRWQEAVSQST